MSDTPPAREDGAGFGDSAAKASGGARGPETKKGEQVKTAASYQFPDSSLPVCADLNEAVVLKQAYSAGLPFVLLRQPRPDYHGDHMLETLSLRVVIRGRKACVAFYSLLRGADGI